MKRLARYEEVLESLKMQDKNMLRKVVDKLKQTDGESWAIGEMVERACALLQDLETSH